MFLNYKRASITYIVLSVCTLGFYSAYFRREIARDLNTACGKQIAALPSAKFVILNILSFGIYATLWDVGFLKLCRDYIEENDEDFVADIEDYRFFGMFPLLRFKVIPDLIREINLVCRIYSDKELDDVSVDDIFGRRRVKATSEDVDKIYASTVSARSFDFDFSAEAAESKKRAITYGFVSRYDQSSRKVAGHAIVEEYDPTKDQRRIGYQMRFKREDEIADKVEERIKQTKAEERLQREREAQEEERRRMSVLDCYRSRSWFKKTIVLLLAVFILPIVMIAVTVFALPPVYDETYMGAVADKYELLNSTKGKKIVVIGGSSTALGLDSEKFKYEFGEYEVVNFGLSSELGIKAMLDLSRSGIKRGDIVIIAPEMSDIGMSLHFNGEAMLRALDGNLGLLSSIESENYITLIGSSLDFACNKIGYLTGGTKPSTPRGAYLRESIDENGDNEFGRPYNETLGVYDKVTFDYIVNKRDSNVTEYEEFIEYVNEYIHYAERKNVKVYYSFAPICSQAIAEDVTEDDIELYYSNLCKSIQCKVISDINNYIFDESYFYDGEFTLNNSGVMLRTIKLVDDLKREYEDASETPGADGIVIPEFLKLSAFPQTESQIESDAFNAQNFLFEPYMLGQQKYYLVSGLTEIGKSAQELTVPDMYNGVPVVGIASAAFNETSVTILHLGNNTAILNEYAFYGSALKAVYIPDGKLPSDIKISGASKLLVHGCNPLLKIYVNKSELELFKSDFGFWEYYKEYITSR